MAVKGRGRGRGLLRRLWVAAANIDDFGPELVRVGAFHAIRRLSPAVVADRGDARFLVSTGDQVIGRTTFMKGAYDLDAMDRAVALLTRHLGRDPVAGLTVIDVGANIGTTTIPLVQRFGAEQVVAIEPSPENFVLLQCNTILNGVQGQVTCVQAAVSSSAGTLLMELSATNSGDHRVRVTDGPGSYAEADRELIPVAATSVDDVLSQAGVVPGDVGLLWVDVQGHEGHGCSSRSPRRASWPTR
ncbi:hypothetical protein BH23ACT9_BH23ACT9_33690 [soil metagenome]